MIYLISRHPGAMDWLRRQVKAPAIELRHLDRPETIVKGDVVIGTLPVNLIADICARGARYFHLQIEQPEHLRGRELSAAMLESLGASLIEYTATRRQQEWC